MSAEGIYLSVILYVFVLLYFGWWSSLQGVITCLKPLMQVYIIGKLQPDLPKQ